jgi:lysophospholipase L1-like esterase
MDCLILGDSIAVGTHRYRPECQVKARGGINSWQYNNLFAGNFQSSVVVISLGSNDHAGINVKKELELLRSKISNSSKVYWILPAKKAHIQNIVKDIAEKNHDIVLPITRLQPDGIHPSDAGYKEIALNIKD